MSAGLRRAGLASLRFAPFAMTAFLSASVIKPGMPRLAISQSRWHTPDHESRVSPVPCPRFPVPALLQADPQAEAEGDHRGVEIEPVQMHALSELRTGERRA